LSQRVILRKTPRQDKLSALCYPGRSKGTTKAADIGCFGVIVFFEVEYIGEVVAIPIRVFIMIKNQRQTAVHLGKYKLPAGRYKTVPYINFECSAEQTEDSILLSIIASYCLDNKETGDTILKVPCSTTTELIVEAGLTVEELILIWEKSVKNLRDKCNNERKDPLKNIPYPSNEQVRASVVEFLQQLNKQE
jgi:hypothetical protein